MLALRKVDFDQEKSNRLYQKTFSTTKEVTGIEGEELWSLCKSLYDRFYAFDTVVSIMPKIPMNIHHIWLGSPLPEELRDYVDSCKKYHQDGWTHYFWTEAELADLPMYNLEFYEKAVNYGLKSDIARLEILYQYGGLYVDTDFECLGSFKELHYRCDLYTGIQPLDTHFLQLGSALIGAAPAHPIIKYAIDTIKDDWHLKGAPLKTGPVHFTKSFFRYAGQMGRIDVAFPSIYFYPLASAHGTPYTYAKWREDGALAVHHWAKMWMPQNYRAKRFRDVCNDVSTLYWNE